MQAMYVFFLTKRFTGTPNCSNTACKSMALARFKPQFPSYVRWLRLIHECKPKILLLPNHTNAGQTSFLVLFASLSSGWATVTCRRLGRGEGHKPPPELYSADDTVIGVGNGNMAPMDVHTLFLKLPKFQKLLHFCS